MPLDISDAFSDDLGDFMGSEAGWGVSERAAELTPQVADQARRRALRNSTRRAGQDRPRWRSRRSPISTAAKPAFVARFFGRRLEYIYEVTELAPGQRLVMRTEQGPFPMETTYTWAVSGDGATRMTLRNRGEPAGLATIAAPVMASAVRRATQADLRRLKSLLESDARFSPPKQ
jgi:hypothetical protein